MSQGFSIDDPLQRRKYPFWARTTRLTAAVLLSVVSLFGRPCTATQLLPMSLKNVSQLAKLSFAGSVSSINYRRLNEQVVTEVRFSDVKLARGRSPDVTVTLFGGVVDGKEYGVIGMPRFELGQRYIILAADVGTPSNSYMPIIGLTQGVFRIMPEPRHGPIVHDLAGRPLTGIQGSHIGVLDRDQKDDGVDKRPPRVRIVYGYNKNKDVSEPAFEIYPPALDPGTRVKEDEFLRAVERLSADDR